MAVKLIDELQKEIKAAGEAVKQEAYEKAYDHVFQILDNLEKLLNDNRYLEGNEITEEDKFEKEAGFEGKILAKLEVFNPTGSVKDRIAKNMIEQAERDGRLKPGGTIIEATSGNTGIGLAAIAAAKGYQAIIVMPDSMSKERIRILEAYGAKVVLTPGEKNMGGANEKAAEILEQTENAIITGQGGNPSNPEAHYQTTGPEIWKDTGENVDIFVATVGTGGTISGTGKFLKEKNPDIQIIGVEPAGCPVLSGGEAGPHKIQGIGGGVIAPVICTLIHMTK